MSPLQSCATNPAQLGGIPENSRMRILITGATGFLGNNLTRALLDNDHEIVATVRHSSDPRPLEGLKVESLPLDLANPSEVAWAVSGCDLVVHSAATIHVGWKNLAASRAANVDSTRTLAEAARRSGARFVHVSTVDTLAVSDGTTPVVETQFEPGKPRCSYVVSKKEAEQVVLDEVNRGLDGIIVNPGFMVGPWDWKPSSGKMMLMLRKQPILYFAPGGGCSVVDVRDVADGIVLAAKRGRTGERYILAGDNMRFVDLWAMMAHAMDKRPPTRPMSQWLAKTVGQVGDLFTFVTRREGEVNSASTEIGQLYSWYSSEKAKRDLGYQIGSIEDALADAWDWFKKFGYC